jgi:hypothetical protein
MLRYADPTQYALGVLLRPFCVRIPGCPPMHCRQAAPHSEACSPRRTLSRRRTPAGAEFSSPNYRSYALPAPLRTPVALRAWKQVARTDCRTERAYTVARPHTNTHARTHSATVCVCIYRACSACTHTHAHTHYTHHTRAHTHTHMHTHTHAHTHSHAHTHTRMHTHTRTHTHMHTHIDRSSCRTAHSGRRSAGPHTHA